MKWTKNQPNVSGYYWVRKCELTSSTFSDFFEPCVKKIHVDTDGLWWFIGNYEYYPAQDSTSGIVFEYSSEAVKYPI